MRTQGLSKQIQREIKAHPVKAGVLAVALLVALWFWAPLVIGWVSGPQAKGTTTPAPTVAAGAVGSVVPGGASATEKKPQWNPSWREMSQWVQSDDTMRPAASLDKARDPFRKVAPPPSAAQAEKPVAPKIDPASLGLELSSTLIGPRHSVAMINGRAYVLPHRTSTGFRQPVQMLFKVQDQQYQLTLVSIGAEQVELEYLGQPLSLRVKDKPIHEKTIELNEKSTFEIHERVSVP